MIERDQVIQNDILGKRIVLLHESLNDETGRIMIFYCSACIHLSFSFFLSLSLSDIFSPVLLSPVFFISISIQNIQCFLFDIDRKKSLFLDNLR